MPSVSAFSPMPLTARRDPFNDPRWIFEVKWDGFRALAHVHGGGAKLVSRRGLAYRQFRDLESELSLELNADDAILDGEIVKLDPSGRPIFADLMRRRGPFAYVAFDVLAANGKDLRGLTLTQRKKVLRAIVPARSATILYAQHVVGTGKELFSAICAHDLEGIVAKRRSGRYGDPLERWFKIKNPEYSKARDRIDVLEPRSDRAASDPR